MIWPTSRKIWSFNCEPGLAAGQVQPYPEHPILEHLRRQQQEAIRNSLEELPGWVNEYVNDLETREEEWLQDRKILQADVTDAQATIKRLEYELREARNATAKTPDSLKPEVDWDQ